MLLLLLYPLRKRLRAMRNLGATRYWFRVHMIFGVLGPLLIIFHSNFSLGSLNSRIALFCTLIVAGSGIIGRYLYGKLHYGLYGQKASLVSLRDDIAAARETDSGIAKIMPSINASLTSLEDEVIARESGFLGALWLALHIEVTSRLRMRALGRLADELLEAQLAAHNGALADRKDKTKRNVRAYLGRRFALLRKFAQYRVCERLFSLWHIVHYPLFILLVLAAIVHVVAVHMY